MQAVPAVATRLCRFTLDVDAVKLEMLRPQCNSVTMFGKTETKELEHWKLTFQEQERFTLSIYSERNEAVASVFNSIHHKSTTDNIP